MSQGKRQKGEKTSPDLYVFLKGFWHTKCRFTRVVIKLFQARNLRNPFYTVNLKHWGLWLTGSAESCWGGASKESRWDPIPSPYQLMDGNVGQCLGHPPHRLVSGAELTLASTLGAGGGRRCSLLQTHLLGGMTSPGRWDGRLRWQHLTIPSRFTRDYWHP